MNLTFEGSKNYVASEELMRSVNIAIALQKPLLIKGEPGTGKTMLAEAISQALGKKLIIWNIKSTTKAQDGLYVYDVVCMIPSSAMRAWMISANMSSLASLAKRSTATSRSFC